MPMIKLIGHRIQDETGALVDTDEYLKGLVGIYGLSLEELRSRVRTPEMNEARWGVARTLWLQGLNMRQIGLLIGHQVRSHHLNGDKRRFNSP